jgi:DUF1680 family protein
LFLRFQPESNLNIKESLKMKIGQVILMLGVLPAICNPLSAQNASHPYPIQPLPFTRVKIQDDFWLPRMITNREVTIHYCFKKCEETGRISNFSKAGGLEKGAFEGIYFNDSDVFKIVEGAAYSLSIHPDPKLDAYLDDLILKIAAAQEEDGYLYTARTIDPSSPPRGVGDKRWCNIVHGHELYNVGHLYEAAVAHFRSSGKRTLLDVAIKSADLIDRVFGPEKKCDVPGHEEIEIGLVKLYRVTKKEQYLNLARFFIDMRGRADKREIFGDYCQDHEPVVEQRAAVGHAVRAGYLYSGMADVAAQTGKTDYLEALNRIWEDVVFKKLYVTGGIGARHGGESFGNAYELPNATAYCETCAAIANALWNHRLFLLHGDARYLDVLERILYNGFLSGVSMVGDTFFYVNPLSSRGQHARSAWFGCSCCPSNVVRFLPSLPGYAYATHGDLLYVNLYFSGEAELPMGGSTVHVKQETRYPWEGKVRITINPERKGAFTVCLRVPGWARGRPVPSDLYEYLEDSEEKVMLRINATPVDLEMEKGFARLRRTWEKGDRIEVHLPMPVRRVICHEKAEANQGRAALERGPVVYCVEGVDHGGHTRNLILPDDAALRADYHQDVLGGVTLIQGTALALHLDENGTCVEEKQQSITAVPYYAWAHRGQGEMDVWLPRTREGAAPLRPPSLASQARASASHTWQNDHVKALNDGMEPKSSMDHALPRFTWWDHKGTQEWVQYDFDKAVEISSVEVYWFDDTGQGDCRVPESWRVLYLIDGTWLPVKSTGGYGLEKDGYNRVSFEPVVTEALRLEVQLQPQFSGGILEWGVR